MRNDEEDMKGGRLKENRGARVGMRGGTTTRTESGMYRKNFWLSEKLNDALRRKAFDERRSETDIICEALSLLLEVDN